MVFVCPLSPAAFLHSDRSSQVPNTAGTVCVSVCVRVCVCVSVRFHYCMSISIVTCMFSPHVVLKLLLFQSGAGYIVGSFIVSPRFATAKQSMQNRGQPSCRWGFITGKVFAG